MALAGLMKAARQWLGTGSGDASLSRREFLVGLGIAGGIAAVSPALLGASEAEAAVPMTPRPDLGEGDVELVQRYEGSRRRYRRRELRRRCRNDRRFRRRNPEICRRVEGRPGRPGSCVQIGPILLCD